MRLVHPDTRAEGDIDVPQFLGFGVEGQRCPNSQAVIDAERNLGFLPVEGYDGQDDPGYMFAASVTETAPVFAGRGGRGRVSKAGGGRQAAIPAKPRGAG